MLEDIFILNDIGFNNIGRILITIPYIIFIFSIKKLFEKDSSDWFLSKSNSTAGNLLETIKTVKFDDVIAEIKDVCLSNLTYATEIFPNLNKAQLKSLSLCAMVFITICISLVVFLAFSPWASNYDFDRKIARIKEERQQRNTRDHSCVVDDFKTLQGISRDIEHKNSEKYPYPEKEIKFVVFRETCISGNQVDVEIIVHLYDPDDDYPLIPSDMAIADRYQHEKSQLESNFENIAYIDLKNSKLYVKIFRKEGEIESLASVSFSIINDGTKRGLDLIATIRRDEGKIKIESSNVADVESKHRAETANAARAQEELATEVRESFISVFESEISSHDFILELLAKFGLDFGEVSEQSFSEGIIPSSGTFQGGKFYLDCEEIKVEKLESNGRNGYVGIIPIQAVEITYLNYSSNSFIFRCNKDFACIKSQNFSEHRPKNEDPFVVGYSAANVRWMPRYDFGKNTIQNYNLSEIKAWDISTQMAFFTKYGIDRKILNDLFLKYKNSCAR